MMFIAAAATSELTRHQGRRVNMDGFSKLNQQVTVHSYHCYFCICHSLPSSDIVSSSCSQRSHELLLLQKVFPPILFPAAAHQRRLPLRA